MTDLTKPQTAPAREHPLALLLCCAGIVGATFAVYSGGLGAPFLYDDVDSVLGNPTIRHLSSALRPPAGLTVSGRPVLNLSFALNFAVSGTATWSYHALNVAIHSCSALLLFGIARRTLLSSCARSSASAERDAIAFAVALLWALHPLQTESVAYVGQRAESLMGLFYLLTLYAFIRSVDVRRPAAWAGFSVAACLLGMGSKEVMATAPLMIMLYDRTFLAGSFREAWHQRRALYLGYAGCWLPLAYLAGTTGGRGGSAGFGSGVAWWAYLMTQFTAVVHYLRFSLWPSPLVGDYGRILAGDPLEVALCALVLLVLLAATWALLRRNSPFGFLGAWFFLVLAPSSSVPPVSSEVMAEHRMYLSLAAVAAVLVLALSCILGRALFLLSVGLLALLLGIVTVRRIRVYGSSFAFWSDVARKVPANAGAWNNLGIILAGEGDQGGASRDYQRALALAPAYAYPHYNLGNSIAETGRLGDADGLFRLNRPEVAAAEYRVALRLRPGYSEAHAYYGLALAESGRLDEAVAECQTALRANPRNADVHYQLGVTLRKLGRFSEAESELDAAHAGTGP